MTPERSTALSPDELHRLDEFRRQHRTALLTVGFVDLVQSTELAERVGDSRFTLVLDAMTRFVRGQTEAEGRGLYVKGTGDGALIVFAEPTAAVEAARSVAEGTTRHLAETVGIDGLQLRIGLHLGQVTIRDSLAQDIFGQHVNRAARVAAAARPGQILVSYPVYDNARIARGIEEGDWVEHGRFRLRGVAAPVPLHELAWSGRSLGRPLAEAAGGVRAGWPRFPPWLLLGLGLGAVAAATVGGWWWGRHRGGAADGGEAVFERDLRAQPEFEITVEGRGATAAAAEHRARVEAARLVLDRVFGEVDPERMPLAEAVRQAMSMSVVERAWPLFDVVDRRWEPDRETMTLRCRSSGERVAQLLERLRRERPAIFRDAAPPGERGQDAAPLLRRPFGPRRRPGGE